MSEKPIGYNGKIAYINLTDKKVIIKDLDSQIAKDFIGGTGLSAKIVYDMLSEEDYKILKENAFSENNPIVFATGPLTGTIRPSSGRYSVSGISPITGIWGEGTSGGKFCVSLRRCGFDAVVINGKAENPIYLLIDNGKIEFKDAGSIWGKDTYKAQQIIKDELNIKNLKVACIGIAGENLVKYACIINDEGRAQGRCGLGAIIGSKNLKALAVHGSESFEGQDLNSMKELRAEIESVDPGIASLDNFFNLYGTNFYMDLGMFLGDVPAYYFTKTEFPADKLTAKTIKEEYPVFVYGCAGCTMQCGKQTLISTDSGKEIKVDGPEYESMAAYGTLCGIFDSKEVIMAHHKCNVYGIDTISSGVSIAFLIYLVENNLGVDRIKEYLKDIKIEEIRWGNSDLIGKLIEKIAVREGIGKLLAEGTKKMAKILNVDPELAANVKGLEIPMHEPRARAGQALSYMTCVTGANHNKGNWYQYEMSAIADANIFPGDPYDITGREQGVINLQNIRAMDDSAVNCNLVTPPEANQLAKYLSYAMGHEYTIKSYLKCGERINNIKRVIDNNLGITRKEYKLQAHVHKVLESGKTMGVKLELEENLKTYYKLRGWDWQTGRPSEEKLKELGIIK
ncbi:MAG: aldehyde ferredoxin oxidoreductase family protein [Promethearchaeota archaeon]